MPTGEVQSHNPAVVQGQLQRPSTLLFGYTPSHTAVYFVGQPVFTSNCFELQHIFEIGVEISQFIGNGRILHPDGFVLHDGLWRTSKEITQRQINRVLISFGRGKTEMLVSGHFSYGIEGCSFPFGNAFQQLFVLWID